MSKRQKLKRTQFQISKEKKKLKVNKRIYASGLENECLAIIISFLKIDRI